MSIRTTPDQGGVGPEADAVAAAPAPAALSCRRRNNSIQPSPSRYRLNALGIIDYEEEIEPETGFHTGYYDVYERHEDREGNQWREDLNTHILELVSQTSTSDRKTVFQFRGNVESFIKYFGRNHCAFWTITDQDDLHPREFAKRWNSFRTNEGGFIVSFMRVLEPQKSGRPHYHFLVAVSWDLEPDKFDWVAFRNANTAYKYGDHAAHAQWRDRYVASTPLRTQQMWKMLRETLPLYGLGRSEFLPIRRGGAQVAEYIGKYLEAGLKLRVHEWKGCRRVEYSRKQAWRWKTHGRQFSWMTDRAKKWRSRIAAIAQAVGASNLDSLTAILGKKWAYKLRNEIISLDDEEFQDWLTNDLQRHRLMHALADASYQMPDSATSYAFSVFLRTRFYRSLATIG